MTSNRGCACGCLTPPLILLLILAIGVFVFHNVIFGALGRYLVDDQPPVKSDAIVALAGDEFGTRATTAGRLVREGWAPYALISGTPHLLTNQAEETIAYAVAQGYPRSYFRMFERDSVATRDETEGIAAYLKAQNVHSILLVTSNYHTRRAGYLMRKAAPWLTVRTVAAPDKYFSADDWWHNRGGQRIFAWEWAKTVSSHIGY
jgi:uncharacterized SAM-binding protein YcdF (DUF218 family)